MQWYNDKVLKICQTLNKICPVPADFSVFKITKKTYGWIWMNLGNIDNSTRNR